MDDVLLVDAMLQNFTFDDSLVFLESDVSSISPDTPRSYLSDISGMSAATLHCLFVIHVKVNIPQELSS